jgi:DNA polymerase-3 subunit epsilon
MTPIFYDTETTGIKPGKDRIIEIAAYDPINKRSFCTFTNPEIPIPSEISQITHIFDDMVKDAPLIQDAMQEFLKFCEGDFVLVAHNNDNFDKLFLEAEFSRAGIEMPQYKFIDSLKWARKYRKDLPKHGLQFLREVYGIDANQAHRALDDCIVLERVFHKMVDDLDMKTVWDLLYSSAPSNRMPFGKHAGKLLTEVPKEYVKWLVKEGALDKKENAHLKETFEKMGYL